jgi:penicillin-binding protein 2
MKPTTCSPGLVRLGLTLLILFTFSFSHAAARGRHGRVSRGRVERRSRGERRREARVAQLERRRGRGGRLSRAERRALAREDRHGGRVHLSRRELRAERRQAAQEEAAYIKKLERKRGRPLSKRERQAEMRRFAGTHRRELEEARRRAEAARLAAIARQRALDEGLRNEAASNIAKDSTVGEDLEVRRAVVQALGNHAATAVVMDPKTGHIYTVVNQDWALRRGFKPCSTIKLVTGLAGISERVIQPIETVSDGNRYRIDLTDALAYSNNAYFQHVGGQVGFDKMVSYAHRLGLGERTGINYPNESPGRVPLFKSGYAVNHMSSHGDDFEVTAIQLATLTSAMANGGKLVTPHVPRTVAENDHFKTEMRRKIGIEDEALRRMVPGMIGAVNYGSGHKAYRPDETVAGKTGTCIGQGSWLGLFTSYAPVANPRLAVVVIARGTDAHKHLPAAVAGNIYRALGPRFGTSLNLQIATSPEASPDQKADKKAAALNEEEAETRATAAQEESGEAAMQPGSKGSESASSGESETKVKPTLMVVTVPNTDSSQEGVSGQSAPAATQQPASVRPHSKSAGATRPRRVGRVRP